MVSVDKSNKTANFEDEYYLLSPSDIRIYPLIYEDCKKQVCSIDEYDKCENVPDCPAYYIKKNKIVNPQPVEIDFLTVYCNNKVEYADCYMGLSLSGSSFVVSPKLYRILQSLGIAGIQFIPVTLVEKDEVIYTDFIYVHCFNFLPILSVKNSKYQTSEKGRKISNNLLQIKFNSKQLNKIKLENRLIFRFPLARSYFIIHISVVEKLLSVNPIGVQFVKISDIDFPDIEGILL